MPLDTLNEALSTQATLLKNAVFTVHWYALDYPGFAGRGLTPLGPVER